MKRNNLLFITLTIVLLVLVSVPSALAYFYTYTEVEGTIVVNLSDGSDIVERIEKGNKIVNITAIDNSEPVFVRVKYIAPSNMTADELIIVPDAEGWSKDGEYYYYAKPIDGKDNTTLSGTTDKPLIISVQRPSDSTDDDVFNVIVLYEMTPAQFSETAPTPTPKYIYPADGGGYWYADWTKTVSPDEVLTEGN